MPNRTRRAALNSIGAAASLALAGCLGGSDDESAEGVGLADHPLGENLGTWPSLGPDPFEAPATLIILDDPSCSRCAAFHQGTVAELETEYVTSGELAIAVRPYPVGYPWGEPAARALEATTARDETAFWGLLEHYFAEQNAFTTDSVLDQTEIWLEENTDLDPAAVIGSSDSKVVANRIEATLSAGDEAGAGSITPVTFAFVDGVLRTSLNGSVSTNTVETALTL